MKVPIGVFGMAAGVASYPTLSRLVADGDVVEAYAVLCRAVRSMLIAIFAAQVCLTLAGFEAAYLIWAAFSSRFTAADADSTATVLGFLCIGLAGWAAQTVISRGFYALGSTWLPTIVGTIVAFAMVPLYVVLRQYGGAIGLAMASSVAILTYVLLLGWLQFRRFKREAEARDATLDDTPGMLGAALQMAVAASIAIGAGWGVRIWLLGWLPGVHLVEIATRAATLCSVGVGTYLVFLRIFGVRELAEVERAAARKFRIWRSGKPN